MNLLRDMDVAVKMLQHDYKNMNVTSFYERKSRIHGKLNDFIRETGGKSDLLNKLGKIALYTGAVATATGIGIEMISSFMESAAALNGATGPAVGGGLNDALLAGAGLIAGAAGLQVAERGAEKKIEAAESLRRKVDGFRDRMTAKQLGVEEPSAPRARSTYSL